ncbi:MAG: isoaspartyl peptidase/L-asparaginase [Candidatus Heimdallarchaeota archaeon]
MKPAILVHGGAWDIPDDLVKVHLNGCREAAETGWKILKSQSTALDAVEAAVRNMELSPTFDAGRGSFLNQAGEVEMDAIIVDGKTMNFGAVAAVRNLLHPVTLARKIMEQTDHVFLVGKGAERFAALSGMNFVLPEDLLVGRELERYRQLKLTPNFQARTIFESEFPDSPSGTVGAVAIDANGDLAAATSTGGTPKKMAGRVGDSPLIGSGAYADNLIGAVSTTGWGEAIAKVVLAKTIANKLQTHAPSTAIQKALDFLLDRTEGRAGAIAINTQGKIGLAFSTPRMAHAWIKEEEKLHVGIQEQF